MLHSQTPLNQHSQPQTTTSSKLIHVVHWIEYHFSLDLSSSSSPSSIVNMCSKREPLGTCLIRHALFILFKFSFSFLFLGKEIIQWKWIPQTTLSILSLNWSVFILSSKKLLYWCRIGLHCAELTMNRIIGRVLTGFCRFNRIILSFVFFYYFKTQPGSSFLSAGSWIDPLDQIRFQNYVEKFQRLLLKKKFF